ncbi:hypothetical protein OIU76_021001 [Salix suchowensis]|uniref:Uncharacterized protein n=2 Tax=Salix TaxID=40685 RepID=A0A9Q1A2N8_SALPP|nr:hypothetical protein OIU76_021001 [Salix suchowensis]KAJ6316322.1 hypothetical protein OIU78_019581 [Salix suchowensis]KAJ6425484.1 hypothetical protein OIU84_026124 [Salix udensis]KAJ6755968.1 hypothetical protein OIU79_028390 [Salix purpurea]
MVLISKIMKAVYISDTALSTSKKGKFGTPKLNTDRTNT